MARTSWIRKQFEFCGPLTGQAPKSREIEHRAANRGDGVRVRRRPISTAGARGPIRQTGSLGQIPRGTGPAPVLTSSPVMRIRRAPVEHTPPSEFRPRFCPSHELLRRQLWPITEPIVTDHFETFAGMQENALGVATPVGARSWFVYALEPARHRQTTAAAKRRPRVAPSPGSFARSVRRVLDTRIDRVPDREPLQLISEPGPESQIGARIDMVGIQLERAGQRPLVRTRPEDRAHDVDARQFLAPRDGVLVVSVSAARK